MLVSPEASIREVMTVIELGPKRNPDCPSGVALVVDKSGELIGVVSDGDLRRAVLAEIPLDSPASYIMNQDPITVQAGAAPVDMIRSVKDRLEKRGTPRSKIDRLIVVDEKHRPVDIVAPFELWRESEVGARPVCIIGMGFVGLTLAATFADVGFEVYGIEQNENTLNMLKKGEPHFFEKNLPQILKRHANTRMKFLPSLTAEPIPADIYIVSVGTPFHEATNEVDYSSLESAATDIGKVLKVGDLIILRSTVPIRTTRERFIPLVEKNSSLVAGRDFSVAFAPERTVEGKALEELRTLPQIVGGFDDRSADLATRLFRTIAPTIVNVGSLEAAEAVKLINNSFRDWIFGFSNHISMLCDRYGLPTKKIINAANEGYPRDRVPHASPGVGGICLRKDPHLLIESAVHVDMDASFFEASRHINRAVPKAIAMKIKRYCEQEGIDVKSVTVGILGVAFKGRPETSDVRGSTALDVVDHLREHGFGTILAHDPLATHADLQNAGMTPTALEMVFQQSQILVLLNNHRVYESMDIPRLMGGSSVKYFYDGWHMFEPQTFLAHGVRYDAMGTDAERAHRER